MLAWSFWPELSTCRSIITITMLLLPPEYTKRVKLCPVMLQCGGFYQTALKRHLFSPTTHSRRRILTKKTGVCCSRANAEHKAKAADGTSVSADADSLGGGQILYIQCNVSWLTWRNKAPVFPCRRWHLHQRGHACVCSHSGSIHAHFKVREGAYLCICEHWRPFYF